MERARRGGRVREHVEEGPVVDLEAWINSPWLVSLAGFLSAGIFANLLANEGLPSDSLWVGLLVVTLFGAVYVGFSVFAVWVWAQFAAGWLATHRTRLTRVDQSGTFRLVGRSWTRTGPGRDNAPRSLDKPGPAPQEVDSHESMDGLVVRMPAAWVERWADVGRRLVGAVAVVALPVAWMVYVGTDEHLHVALLYMPASAIIGVSFVPLAGLVYAGEMILRRLPGAWTPITAGASQLTFGRDSIPYEHLLLSQTVTSVGLDKTLWATDTRDGRMRAICTGTAEAVEWLDQTLEHLISLSLGVEEGSVPSQLHELRGLVEPA